jgi:uncharacterized membrane protein
VSARLESWSRPAEQPAGPLGVAAAAAALFVLAWAVLHVGFYAKDEIVDTPLYQDYGNAITAGRVPYRDFDIEYPPAALPAFVIPALAANGPTDGNGYRRVFEVLMVACGLAALMATTLSLGALGARRLGAAAALAFVALSPLALGSVERSRFDLWPAALTALALAAVLRGRSRLGAAVLGLAAAAKIYPLVLVPLLAVWVWRREGRRAALAALGVLAAALATCFAPFVLLAPGGVVSSLHGQFSRPLQIESLGAAALVAFSHLGGSALTVVTSHGSQNIAGRTAVAAATVSSAIQALALLAIWIAFARGPMRREQLVRSSAAAVVAFVAFGKVLSPQYLIWLVPLVPLVRDRRGLAATAVLAGAAVMTQAWFPFRYANYAQRLDEGVSWLVLARDLVLVGLLAVLVWPTRAAAAPR